MSWWSRWQRGDRLAGGVAGWAGGLGQMALVALGIHLAADNLDDGVARALQAAQHMADDRLSGPLTALAGALGLPAQDLFFWQDLPLAPLSAASALVVELTTTALLWSSFLLSPRTPALGWADYRRALCIHALLLPPVLLGVIIAGSWSLAMAAEDLLPAGPLAPWASGLLALAALLRFGLPALRRAIGALQPDPPWRQGAWAAPFLLVVGGLAWVHGVPLWGWLP